MTDKFPLTKLVEVLWEDMTTNNTGWLSPDAALEGAYAIAVRTVGYVLNDKGDNLTLVMLQSPNMGGEVGVTAVIPKGSIRRMKVLKGLT